MSKTASLIVGVVLIVVVGGFVYWQKKESIQQTAQSNTQQGTYTHADVAQHKDKTSCWSVIEGTVYDLTSWIPRHPGGEAAILSICGIDGTAKFTGQHDHNALQQQILAGFKIGTLSQ